MWSDSSHSVACYSGGFIDVTPTRVYFSAGTEFRNSMRITQPERPLLSMSDSEEFLTLHVFDKEVLRIPVGFRLPSGFGVQLSTLTLVLDLGWSMSLFIDSGLRPRGICTLPSFNTKVLLGESEFTCDIVGLTQDGKTYLGSNTLYVPATKPGVLLQSVTGLTVAELTMLPGSNLRVVGKITYHSYFTKDHVEEFTLDCRPYTQELAIKGLSYSGGHVFILSDKVYFSEGITCVENIVMGGSSLRFSPSTASTVKISAFGTSVIFEKNARLPAGFTLGRDVLELDIGWAKTITVSRELSDPFVAPAKCMVGTAQWKCSHVQLHKDGTLGLCHDKTVEIIHAKNTHYRAGKLQIHAPLDVLLTNTHLHLFLFKRVEKTEDPVVDVIVEDETTSLLRYRGCRG